MGRKMNLRLAALAVFSILLTACTSATRRAEFSGGYPVHDCPEQLVGQVNLQAEVRPIELNTSGLHATSIATTGSLGRRMLVSVTPSGLDSSDRIVWSRLTIASYGGTFVAWDRLQTNPNGGESVAPVRTEHDEIVTVALSPGQVKITRSARGKKDLAGMHSIDLLVMPGGVTVDDAVVRIPKLWHDNGVPVAAADIAPQFVPVRHPPGLDVVEANMELDFVVRAGATGDEWTCSAEGRLTLVDQDSLRQPFWDLGLAASNSGRREWLALVDPAFGAVRLVVDSPASAHALASWIRATGSTRIGSYSLAAFRQPNRRASRPFGPVDEELMRTIRPVAVDDIRTIVVGPVGEP